MVFCLGFFGYGEFGKFLVTFFFLALIEEGISGFTSKTSNKLKMCVCTLLTIPIEISPSALTEHQM